MSRDVLLLQARDTDGFEIQQLAKRLFALFSTPWIGDTGDNVLSFFSLILLCPLHLIPFHKKNHCLTLVRALRSSVVSAFLFLV